MNHEYNVVRDVKIIHVDCIIMFNQLQILMMEFVDAIDTIYIRLIDDDNNNLRKTNMMYLLCVVCTSGV